MSAFHREKVLSVRHWTDTLFSFTATRDPAFRFLSGQFTMIGLQVDGKPLLRDLLLKTSQCRGEIVAITTFGPNYRGSVLRLFRMPTGFPSGHFSQNVNFERFALSEDGRYLARQVGFTEVEVRATEDAHQKLLQIPRSKYHPAREARISRGRLATLIGRHLHIFDWHDGVLTFSYKATGRGFNLSTVEIANRSPWLAFSDGIPEFARWDSKRFLKAAFFDVFAVLDAFGQIALFDRSGRLICMFFTFRHEAAGWMPDGTRFGPPSVSQGPETPGWPSRFGQALREASECGRAEEP